jgi:hypothetical protein
MGPPPLTPEPQASHTKDASTSPQWEIGQGFMLLDNVFLSELKFVSRGSAQAELYVLGPTM